MHTPSSQQQAVYDFAKSPLGSLAIDAKAGTGKTATLQGIAQRLPGSGLATSFSRSTVADLSEAMPANWDVIGLHSLGYRAIRAKLPSTKLDKNGNALYEYLKDTLAGESDCWKLLPEVRKLVEMAALSGIVPSHEHFALPDTPASWEQIADTYDIDFSPLILSTARSALTYLNNLALKGTITFTHMLTLPLFWNFPIPQYPKIIIDEAQDLNILQQLITLRALRPGGRMFMAGDPNQAIFAFSGALPDSFPTLVSRLNATVQPLTVSWRCARAIIREAQRYVPSIEAAPDAPEGEVISHPPSSTIAASDLPGTIICRNNAPLMRLALRLIVNGRSVEIAGAGKHGIAAGLKSTIKRIASGKNSDRMKMAEFLERLRRWTHREITRRPARAPSINDKLAVLSALASHHRNLGNLRTHLDQLYIDPESPSNRPVAHHLTTIHKCVIGSTIIETLDGPKPIQEASENETVATLDGWRTATKIHRYTTPTKTLKITTTGGYTLEGTPNHRIMLWADDGFKMSTLDALKVGTILRIPLERPCQGSIEKLPPKENRKDIREIVWCTPEYPNEDFARFLGIMTADGTLFDRGFRFVKPSFAAVTRFAILVNSIYGVTPTLPERNDICFEATISSTYLARWLQKIEGIQPNNKSIPNFVLKWPRRLQGPYISGLFEDSGVNIKKKELDHIAFSQSNAKTAFLLQQMLLRFGIISRRFLSAKGNWRVDISGHFAKKFISEIGFFDPTKQIKAEQAETPKIGGFVPFTWKEAALLPTTSKQNARHRGTAPRQVVSNIGDPYDKLKHYYLRVVGIKTGNAPVYCLEIPKTEAFIQNGFDAGNSKGREWPSVGFLDPHLLNSSHGLSLPWEADQERNLAYVATTRTRTSLHYINSKSLI